MGQSHIINFESLGMRREKALLLARQFNLAMRSFWGQTLPGEVFEKNALRINGNIIHGHYNFREIEELVISKSYTDLPLIRWLQANNDVFCSQES